MGELVGGEVVLFMFGDQVEKWWRRQWASESYYCRVRRSIGLALSLNDGLLEYLKFDKWVARGKWTIKEVRSI